MSTLDERLRALRFSHFPDCGGDYKRRFDAFARAAADIGAECALSEAAKADEERIAAGSPTRALRDELARAAAKRDGGGA